MRKGPGGPSRELTVAGGLVPQRQLRDVEQHAVVLERVRAGAATLVARRERVRRAGAVRVAGLARGVIRLLAARTGVRRGAAVVVAAVRVVAVRRALRGGRAGRDRLALARVAAGVGEERNRA